MQIRISQVIIQCLSKSKKLKRFHFLLEKTILLQVRMQVTTGKYFKMLGIPFKFFKEPFSIKTTVEWEKYNSIKYTAKPG